MRTRPVVALVAALIWMLVGAELVFAGVWGSVEVMPFVGSSDDIGPIKVDPLGNYFVSFGSAGNQAKARDKYVVRPPGPGQAFGFPKGIPGLGAVDIDFEFDAAGNSWWIWATGTKVQIAQRPPGAAANIGAPFDLDTGLNSKNAAVGVSPDGDVLAVWAKGPDLFAAVKAAGAADFSAPQTIASEPTVPTGGYIVYANRLWATLDAGGSAVLVWEQLPLPGGTADIKQSVRSPGALTTANFSGPTTIVTDIFQAFYAEGLGKHATLVWKKDEGSPGSSSGSYSMSAAKRAPGSGFSGAGPLLSDEEQNGVGVIAPHLSVASDGAAAVSWIELDSAFVSCPPPVVRFAKVAFAAAGGGFVSASQLISGSNPYPEHPAVGLARAGSWVAGWPWGSPAGANPCAQQQREMTTKASGGEVATFALANYDNNSVRAAGQAVGSGFEGLVAWIESSGDDLQAAHFDDAGPLVSTTTSTLASTTTTSVSSTTTTLLPPNSCGDATMDGELTASDALAALRGAVGAAQCLLCLCDTTGDASLTATDALLILESAVGQAVMLSCVAC